MNSATAKRKHDFRIAQLAELVGSGTAAELRRVIAKAHINQEANNAQNVRQARKRVACELLGLEFNKSNGLVVGNCMVSLSQYIDALEGEATRKALYY